MKKGANFGFDGQNGQRNNLLIEGDNYHALQVLQHTHRGSIDVIYIDPPYNTGKGDFKYNDRFVSDEDGNKHSAWLSFMEKRLELASTLLSSKGLIFISINTHEGHRLKLLCDQVFGEKNLMGDLVWDLGTGTTSGHFTRSHEYVFCYSKKKSAVPLFRSDSGFIEHSALKKPSKLNPLSEIKIKAGAIGIEGGLSKTFSGRVGGSEYIDIKGEMSFVDGVLSEDVVLEAGWAMKNMLMEWLEGKEVYDTKGQRVVEFFFSKSGKLRYKKERGFSGLKTVLPPDIFGNTKNGGAELSDLLDSDFSYPKPTSLLVNLMKNVDGLVFMDFFAGSGTLGHAVMEMNKLDGMDRKFILVTNNESNICEDVTYERLLRCNLPEHGNYQQGLEYLQLKHVAETEVDGYDMASSFEHIKQVANVRFDSFNVIEETDDWYITDKIAVLKNYVKYPAFFEKYGEHPAYGLVTKKERQAQTFRTEAAKRVSIDDIHVFNKEYLNDLYRVVREDMA